MSDHFMREAHARLAASLGIGSRAQLAACKQGETAASTGCDPSSGGGGGGAAPGQPKTPEEHVRHAVRGHHDKLHGHTQALDKAEKDLSDAGGFMGFGVKDKAKRADALKRHKAASAGHSEARKAYREHINDMRSDELEHTMNELSKLKTPTAKTMHGQALDNHAAKAAKRLGWT